MGDFEFLATFNTLSEDKRTFVIKAAEELLASQTEPHSQKERAG